MTSLQDDNGKVQDAISNSWVDTQAPAFLRPYFRLSRLDRPVGSWLLFLPCAFSVAFGVANNGAIDKALWVLFVCFIGSVLMRGAGCTWNDYVDREFDAQVARTRSRPLPSGQVSPKAALVWMVLQAAIAFFFLTTLNLAAIIVACASLGIVAIYPFAKRFTYWPQFVLGLAFNWGAFVGYAGVKGSLSFPILLLYIGCIFWTLFYDTIYAYQDIEDDAKIGVKSTARLFEGNANIWLMGFILATAGILLLSVGMSALTNAAIFAVFIFAAYLLWIWYRFDANDPENCLRLFRENVTAGQVFAVLLLLLAVV